MLTETFVILLFLTTPALEQCLRAKNPTKVKFYLMKKCARSDAGLVSRTHSDTSEKCASYAREKKGLAFNYNPNGKSGSKRAPNCQVLGCPETANLTTLVNDTEYDYYTAYGNYTILQNANCIKSIGMFRLFTEKENYTTAIESCLDIGADLAHILTESRTNFLSNVVANGLSGDWYKAAYVGLDDTRREGLFETPLGEPIGCYKFRAWGPGHPRNRLKSDDCVVIDSERSWKVVNCRSKLPFLCEFFTSSGGKREILKPDKNGENDNTESDEVNTSELTYDEPETSDENYENKYDDNENIRKRDKRADRCQL